MALAVLILSYIVVNVWWLHVDARIPIYDTAWHFVSSLGAWEMLTHLSVESMKHFALYAFQPPLVGILVRPFYFLFGTNIDAATLGMVIVFVPILAVSVYKTISILVNNRRLALLGVFSLMCYPGIFFFSRFYLLDLPLTAMVSLAIYLLLRSDNFDNLAYSLYFAVAAALGMLTKAVFFVYLTLPFLFTILFVRSRRQFLHLILSAVVFVIPTFLWYFVTRNEFLLYFNEVFLKPKLAPFPVFAFLFFVVLWLPLRRFKNIIFGILFAILIFSLLLNKSWLGMLGKRSDYFLVQYSNNLIGFGGLIAYLISLILLWRLALSVPKKVMLALWALSPLFVFYYSDCTRYLLPTLPAVAVLIIVVLSYLSRNKQIFMQLLLYLNAIFVFVICTWNIGFLPQHVTLFKKSNIEIINATPTFEDYGPPQPKEKEKEWALEEFIKTVKEQNMKPGSVVWLLPAAKFYGTGPLNYYSEVDKLGVEFWGLILNKFDNDVVKILSDPKYRYFLDVEGFKFLQNRNWKNKLAQARNYLKEHTEEFEIIFKHELPGNEQVVLYKKVKP